MQQNVCVRERENLCSSVPIDCYEKQCSVVLKKRGETNVMQPSAVQRVVYRCREREKTMNVHERENQRERER